MKKTLFRIFFLWSFEREEAWLNEMAAQGWALESLSFCLYHFRKCEPGEYVVRLQYSAKKTYTTEGMDYIRFIEGTGAEYICGYFNWLYFRKKASEGVFELFSDLDSRLRHLRRILYIVLFITVPNLLLLLSSIINIIGEDDGSRYNIVIFQIAANLFFTYGLARTVAVYKRIKKLRRMQE